MKSILYRYLMIIVACISLLIGLQIPNFVDQYQKRVDAHLREVTINLLPFQEIADKFFNGDLNQLIELHRKSDAKPFQEEGLAIEMMVQRKLRFEADLSLLKTSLPKKALNILLHGDKEILDEAVGQYSYSVPLNQDALVFGASVALVILLMLELLFAMARLVSTKLFGPAYRPSSYTQR
jgi:hypothetical protein